MSIALTRFPLWMALAPLAAYLGLLAWLHARRRPVALAGQVDAALLAGAVVGLVVAGPLAVLQPALGTSPWTAVSLVVGFALVVAFGMLAARPRLVVYNVGIDQLRPVIAQVVRSLDASARWAGETAALPARRLQVHLDARGPARTVSVIAVGGRAATEAWPEFSRRLRRAIRPLAVARSPWAAVFAALALAVAAVAAWSGLA